MIRIKNLRAGIVFVTDAGLKLLPGQAASVDSLSAQMQMLIDKGYVAKMDSSMPKAGPHPQKEELPSDLDEKSDQSTKVDMVEPDGEESDLPPVPAEYDAMNARESVEFIKKCEDLPLLRAILKKEPRKTVLDDLVVRIKELG